MIKLFNAWQVERPFASEDLEEERLLKHRDLAESLGMKTVFADSGRSFPVYISTLEKELIIDEMDRQLDALEY